MPLVPVTSCYRGTLGLPCFGLDPTSVTCPFCRNTVTTKVLPRYEPLTKCEACCYPFIYLCCCFCCEENHDIKHVCPNCNKVLGRYRYTQDMVYVGGPSICSKRSMPRVPNTVCHLSSLGLPCFGLEPTTVTCPFCRNKVTTKVLPRYKPGWEAFCCAAYCGCCKNYDIKHVCPNCNQVLGIYHYV